MSNKLDIDILVNEDDFEVCFEGEHRDLVDAFINIMLLDPNIYSVIKEAVNDLNVRNN